MDTDKTTAGKSANPSTGALTQATTNQPGTLLSRADYGLHVTGRIDSVSEVNHRSGKTVKDKDYSFWQQTAHVSVGGQMFEVVFRADTEPKGLLCPFDLDEVVRLKVENARIFNGKLSFDACK